MGTGFDTTPGGKGANQAVAVARLGYPVEMIGSVGEDVFGQALLDNLTRAGVGVSGVTRVSGPSGVAPILVDDRGQNSIVVIPGANGKVDTVAVDRHADLIRSAGMVLCQLELPLSTVAHAIALCATAGVPVMLDPAPAAPLPAEFFPNTTWFTPNETEALLYTSHGAITETTASELIARSLAGVVLKRGSEGAYVATAQGLTAWIKPFHVQAIDTVGAGDCFNGAFAVALLEGQDPITAARFASAAAAISVTRRGAQASMPSRAEVDAFLAEHIPLD
jgi:ribokinase